VRRFFRRDRLTGQIAIGVVGVLCAAAVLFGVGMASAKYRLSDVGGWLTSDRKGEVVHVNGLTGKVDGKVEIAGSNGHLLKVVQDGGSVLLVDETTHVVSRIDPAQLNTVQGATYQGAQDMQVVEGTGVAYALSPFKGTVQQLDPMSLASMGGSVTLTAPLGTSNAVDAESALWVPVPAAGQAADKPNGQQVRGVPIGKVGDTLTLTMASGAPVVTDSSTAQSLVVGPGGTKMTVNLPSAVTQASGGVLAPTSTDGLLVPLLNPQTGSLALLDAGSGSIGSVGMTLPAHHQFAAPQMLGQRVYIPDKTAGDLIVYDNATHSQENPVNLTGRADPTMDVFVKGGLLWANDPEGNKALVINSTGQATPISKYTNAVPGGANNPIPKAGNPNGDKGAANPGNNGPGGHQNPTNPPPTHHQTPPTHKPTSPVKKKPLPPPPPGAPPGVTNVAASNGDGSMSVTFTPSVTTPGTAPATQYTLDVEPPISGYTPQPISASATSTPGWSINGGSCGTTYTMTVLTQWTDKGKAGTPVPPQGTPPTTLSCSQPTAPGNVSASAHSDGAHVSWDTPANAANSHPVYTVKWTGPVPGELDNVTGTSATAASVNVNGSYSFTVTASDGAGAGAAGSWNGGLTGPSVSYTGQHAGVNENSHVCNRAGNCSTNGNISNYNGQSVTVDCQVKGDYYTHGNGASAYYNGDMWDYIEHGSQGFIIGYLLATPRQPDWQDYAGLPLWQCSSQSGR
jgi:hypothetical protein